MATRNIVPRENHEGSIGTESKSWGNGVFDEIKIKGQSNVPTAPEGDASAKIASTEFVTNLIAKKVEPYQLQRNTHYKVGDVVTVPALGGRYYLECIQEGTTAAVEPDLSTLLGGVTLNDGLAKWIIKTMIGSEDIVLVDKDTKYEDSSGKIASTRWVRSVIEKIVGVTYRLEEIGYVRLGIADGLTLIWGVSAIPDNTQYIDVQYPITVKATYVAIPADTIFSIQSATNDNSSLKWNKDATTATSIRFLSNIKTTSAFGWIAICKS